MTAAANILEQLSPLFFPVAEERVMVGNVQSSDHKAIVRPDTGEVLAIHGSGYNLTPNEAILTQFVKALETSGLDLSGAVVQAQHSHAGARMFAKVRLPAHQVDIGGGDLVDLQMSVINSYDGWTAFKSIFGGFRLLCSNGMVIGQKMWQGYGRHTQGLDITASAQKLERVGSQYLETASVWEKWSRAPITIDQMAEVIQAVTPVEKTRTMLEEQFMRETVELGSTVWAGYNALTHWSTHTVSNRNNASNVAAAAQFQREEQVRKVLPMLYRVAA